LSNRRNLPSEASIIRLILPQHETQCKAINKNGNETTMRSPAYKTHAGTYQSPMSSHENYCRRSGAAAALQLISRHRTADASAVSIFKLRPGRSNRRLLLGRPIHSILRTSRRVTIGSCGGRGRPRCGIQTIVGLQATLRTQTPTSWRLPHRLQLPPSSPPPSHLVWDFLPHQTGPEPPNPPKLRRAARARHICGPQRRHEAAQPSAPCSVCDIAI
jgi:hypothetical protein